MAQLAETVAVIKISRLIKDGDPVVLDTGVLEQLEEVAKELAGSGALVEFINPEE